MASQFPRQDPLNLLRCSFDIFFNTFGVSKSVVIRVPPWDYSPYHWLILKIILANSLNRCFASWSVPADDAPMWKLFGKFVFGVGGGSLISFAHQVRTFFSAAIGVCDNYSKQMSTHKSSSLSTRTFGFNCLSRVKCSPFFLGCNAKPLNKELLSLPTPLHSSEILQASTIWWCFWGKTRSPLTSLGS